MLEYLDEDLRRVRSADAPPERHRTIPLRSVDRMSARRLVSQHAAANDRVIQAAATDLIFRSAPPDERPSLDQVEGDGCHRMPRASARTRKAVAQQTLDDFGASATCGADNENSLLPMSWIHHARSTMWNNGDSPSRVATEANSSRGMASVDECRHGKAGSRREDRANAPISAQPRPASQEYRYPSMGLLSQVQST